MLFLSLFIQLSLPVQAQSEALCVSKLEQEINRVVESSEWRRSRWGILVQTLDSGETLYNLDEERYFLPASSLKLLTTAAALLELGPQYQIATPVYIQGEMPNIERLSLLGRGDPSLSSDRLRQLARDLKLQGVDVVEELVIEDSYFRDSGINPTWELSDLYFYYAVGVNSLILDENTVVLTILPQDLDQPALLRWSNSTAARQWRVHNRVFSVETATEGEQELKISGLWGNADLTVSGELPRDGKPSSLGLGIPDPSSYFLESLYRLFLVEQIKVTEARLSDQSLTADSLGEVFTILLSPPIEKLIAKINQESNNLYAEALLKILEQESGKKIEDILTELGVNPESYQLVDGSGLSRHNLVSPQALVQTLSLMTQSPYAEIYRHSLPQPGNPGTLSSRWSNLERKPNLQAKSGYLTGVASLSGYLYPQDYQPLVFTIILNQSEQPGESVEKAIDRIILLLTRLKRC
ncbi:D-alanyl-D-alanine carboxypeptidase/D-alanyl-D-alanine-endopeptidase [Gloeocapsa sp. PCC 73106]|uniref:D-alanyl-D-alanine carboxypeptidase/D-alanyl-D-alanine endopeptidase n=1 Tax=Gloeocapsa sp. PCC 73106 TaxID=102232 RepID=UPI0002AC1FC5|nr:D-alanyl-D-alanine carboxypeptidase/D-alanyl-D-alanine-endopeptidase [Gloeocapsa sp. PCC 73106]ELR98226.1 D-alanyl-D-alanine carboxypeptidase, serine-type, PBP4 family [Gloeocapsa sp. PCC 73106]